MGAPRELPASMAFLAGAMRGEAPVPGDEALARASARHVTGSARLSPAEQVDIYRRQFWMRHLDSLVEDHPGLAALLGAEALDAFLRAYLAAHPPRTPSLRDLGADLVGFAERHEGFPAGLAAVAREMVRYEHAFIDLFDGAEPPPLDPLALAALPEDGLERARVALHPLLVWRRFEYPVHTLRLAAGEGSASPTPTPTPERAPVRLALFRKDFLVHYRELEALELRLLDALAAGEPLGAACARLAESPEAAGVDLDAKVGAWFRAWTELGWIVGVAV